VGKGFEGSWSIHLQGQAAFSRTLLELFDPKDEAIMILRNVENVLASDKA
jgi:hypothetical protein